MKSIILIGLILLTNATHTNAGAPLHLLSNSQIKDLEENKVIVLKEKVENKIWPRLKIFALVNSQPLNSMGIFAAYDYQKNYVPKLARSKVVEQPTATNVLVEYELEMPWPLSNGVYVHGHHLKKIKDGYEVEWYLVKSTSADSVNGRASFTNYKNKTLMYYVSLVEPKSIFAGVLRKLMVNDVVKTIKAIIAEIEKVEQSNPKLKEKYSLKIKNALVGKKSY